MDQQQLGKHGPGYKRWQPFLLDRYNYDSTGSPIIDIGSGRELDSRIRKELEVAVQNPLDQFCFKLDGRKVSRGREH